MVCEVEFFQLQNVLSLTNTVTTNCVVEELESLGSVLYGAAVIAKRFQLRNCGHVKESQPAAECIKNLIGKLRIHDKIIHSFFFFIRTFFIRTLRLRNAQKLRTC